ncbi:CBS domain-containing protein (plasmid) [Streptomyces sp. BHT-5-2]|uniref:CBS domain-containing protein n=1 Tax=unclassified Streptomyces TaxID=2593676 RepID=UPI001C8F1188|nr:CBS domain-containing protein [Streptomyces sp. BHT-5-2]QZL08909.1 CBS domain-containing protein [Streptomyces sp. BHT-5-2]
MRIRDVMRTPVVTVTPDTTLRDTARLMARRTVGCVVVVSAEAVLGMVTDRDLAVRGLGAERCASAPVGEVMTVPAQVVRPGDDVDAAYRTMARSAVRRLAVVDEGRLVGVVALDDLLMDVSRRLSELLGAVSWCVLAEPPPAGRASPG